ncbi:hypothetical protein QZH41_014138 [Actinostola sp. cb2023]|nr:hypothetical protein QZH41_014138 [Actinostola sp. cb2023]
MFCSLFLIDILNLIMHRDDDTSSTGSCITQPHALLIEPFYGGSHKQLIDLLLNKIPGCIKDCLPAKKWHWRMRTSALYFAMNIPENHNFCVLFASSVLNLAELVALRPDLAPVKKVLYFHENQLVYPVRKQQERDFQYGYNQIISWEHDKNPEAFFNVLFHLLEEQLEFKVSVIGEKFSEIPSIFEEGKTRLGDRINNWGYQESRNDYTAILLAADVAVSTAEHEFFGVAMLEAVQFRCYPLCPNRLVYPEIFPSMLAFQKLSDFTVMQTRQCHYRN